MKLSNQKAGYTLVELMVCLAIIGILAQTGMSSYRLYLERVDFSVALIYMNIIEKRIKEYYDEANKYPDSLSQVGAEFTDPWGNPFYYLNLADVKGKGKMRKDKNLVPINTDYDLYSAGKDGQTTGPLTAKQSRDDIIRAGNGSFKGLASDF